MENEKNTKAEEAEVKVEQQEKVVEPKIKIKKKPKKFVEEEPAVIKVDLTKKPKEKVEETKDVAKLDLTEKPKEEVVEEVKEEKVAEVKEDTETPIVEKITDEVVEETKEEEVPTKEEVVEAIEESKQTGVELPENIQKAVAFINETGGSLEDYVSLNTDYSKHDDISLLREYYRKTKGHLDSDEVDFLIQESIPNEDMDDEREIKRKKIALKEQVANAKSHLDGLKSKYYEEIKAGSKLLPEQQKAVEFFNRYTKEAEENQKIAEVQASTFQQKTNEVFNDSFKGFEYNIGEKKFRYNVKNAEQVKSNQSSIDNFVKKFLDKRNTLSDAKGYHKSMFTAMNPDAIANHFYEQGKADALKESIAKSKNVSMDPRQSHANEIKSGIKVRAIPGNSSADFKIKMNRNKFN